MNVRRSRAHRACVLGLAAIVLACLPLGCQDEPLIPVLPAVCGPVLDGLEPDEGPVDGGTGVTISGHFLVGDDPERDLVLRVGAQDAEVTATQRSEGCVACDGCVAAYQNEFREGSAGELSCDAGGQEIGPANEPGVASCLEWVCDRVCRGLSGWCDHETGTWYEAEACTEEITFITPPAEGEGEAEVVLHSSRGNGLGLVFRYVDDDGEDTTP